MIIYKATNKNNGKFYIGQTTRPLKDRIREHNHTSKGGRFITYFYRAILKHGKDAFIWEIIDTANSIEELNQKEEYWISALNATDKSIAYNNKKGGQNGKHMKEARDKISAAGRKPCSEEKKRKLSEANKGQVPWAKGRTFTKEHRQKISMSQKKRIIDIETAKTIKKMITNGYKSTVIASHFKIPVYIVYNIKHGKSWRHV